LESLKFQNGISSKQRGGAKPVSGSLSGFALSDEKNAKKHSF